MRDILHCVRVVVLVEVGALLVGYVVDGADLVRVAVSVAGFSGLGVLEQTLRIFLLFVLFVMVVSGIPRRLRLGVVGIGIWRPRPACACRPDEIRYRRGRPCEPDIPRKIPA